MNTGTIVHFKNSINVSKNISVHSEPVLQAAFYDIFKHKQILEEFVRNLAGSDIQYPVDEAQELLEFLD